MQLCERRVSDRDPIAGRHLCMAVYLHVEVVVSWVVGVQDKLLHQVTCGVKQDVLENRNREFQVHRVCTDLFAPALSTANSLADSDWTTSQVAKSLD